MRFFALFIALMFAIAAHGEGHSGGASSGSATPAASTGSKWDSNVNMSANSFIPGYTTIATAAATTTLLVGSTEQQYFTGSTTQNVLLPVTSTLALGQQYIITNLSSGAVTVKSSGANVIQAMAANTELIATVISTSGTGTASWSWVYTPQNAADIALDNLGTTSINAALLPNANNAIAFGSAALNWSNVWANQYVTTDGAGGFSGGLTNVFGTSDVLLRDLVAAHDINFQTAANGGGASGHFIFAPGTASNGVQGQMKIGGHIISNAITTAPSITAQSCVSGTPTVAGTDVAGLVTMATTCTSATVTFGQVFTTAPICVASIDATTGLAIGATTSTSTLILTATFPSGSKIQYICVGY